MSREAHEEACAYTAAEIEALVRRIVVAKEKHGEVMASLMISVGSDSLTDAGRSTFGILAEVGEMLDDLMGRCAQAQEELIRYRGGF